jgi:D-glycero-D-manno-heptose 1,7-bisphosphate phosphatase
MLSAAIQFVAPLTQLHEGGSVPRIDCILLDRDGTVIVDKHYLSDPQGVELLPGAGEALAGACAEGRKLFIVTNQSGIGRGMFSENDYEACRVQLDAMLQSCGASVTASRHCPHAPDSSCICRKPETGLWQTLRDAYGLKAERCVMVGDKLADVGFGRNACLAASVLVLTGKGRAEAEKAGLKAEADMALREDGWVEVHKRSGVLPDVVACDVRAALDWVRTVLEEK